MSFLQRLRGQNEEEREPLLTGLVGPGLRRSYVVIVGQEAPAGEIMNAQQIATYLRRKLNLVAGAFVPIRAGMPGLNLLTNLVNVVAVGGPISNEWAFLLNDYCNPRFDITVNREREAGETWAEYTANGGITINNYILDEATYAFTEGSGIIGFGQKRLLDRVIIIAGRTFEDTCAVGKAFREDQGPGLYECSWTEIPDMEICPEDADYTLSAAPAL